MQLIKMVSGTESEVEVDEAQGEASGSCSTSTTSGVGKEKRRSKVWLYFQKIIKSWMVALAEIVLSVQNAAKLLKQKQETPLI